MLHDYLQVYKLSIVLIGDFNPVIIQPFWLANKALIRETEANSAKVEVIHNDIVKFELDWVIVEVTKQRFELKCNQEPYFETVKDLASSIFKILRETPLKALGINHVKDFSLRNEEQYYSFGDKLSPLNNWKNFLNDPRLLNIEILENKRRDGLNGNYNIRIKPCSEIIHGISFFINDHYDFPYEKGNGTSAAIDTLNNQWQNSLERAKEVIESLWDKINL